MDIQKLIDHYHKSVDVFSRGDPQPVKAFYSHEDDVMLANPFGLTVTGWKEVSEALDLAASHFRDGEVANFHTIQKYVSPDLVTIFEIEKWKAKVTGRPEVSSFELRVTSTFRYEINEWKLIHRHGDPISSFKADGPLRGDL